MSRFHTRNPKIFGSVSRGEDTEASDLDISIEVDQGISYYDLAQIEIELEAILGCKVDVVTRGCLAPDVAEHGMSREQFLDDEKTQDAASKCAEAIGEAANQLMALDPTYNSRHPELQLKNAYKSRLWLTVSQSIPSTVAAARNVLAELDGGEGAGGGASGGPP